MKRLCASVLLLASAVFPAAAQQAPPPTPAEAETFMANAEGRLLQLAVEAARADWVKINLITGDTELLAPLQKWLDEQNQGKPGGW